MVKFCWKIVIFHWLFYGVRRAATHGSPAGVRPDSAPRAAEKFQRTPRSYEILFPVLLKIDTFLLKLIKILYEITPSWGSTPNTLKFDTFYNIKAGKNYSQS